MAKLALVDWSINPANEETMNSDRLGRKGGVH
jgi:hypothetical protein